MKNHRVRAFTVIELLVVVSIIALLVGILLPAIGKARDQARMTISQANLRNIGTAMASYAAEWSDRQLTFVDDNIATYAESVEAFTEYWTAHGGGSGTPDEQAGREHPPVALGWGRLSENGGYAWLAYRTRSNAANQSLATPISFRPQSQYFGAFRLINASQFNQYLSGRFYDKVFYAPKDTVVIDAAKACFESPDQFCRFADVSDRLGDIPAWSSYCMSPAAMFNPEVMSHDDEDDARANGWQDPWTLPAGFRSPAMSQARFPNLKTHVLEHHWLQGATAGCNPNYFGTYGQEECEPYYFNHAWESSPVTLFYDSHVENIGTRQTMRADGRVRVQTGNENWGLWSQDTVWEIDGYLSEVGYDRAQTSFHILTTDGIRGRDILGD